MRLVPPSSPATTCTALVPAPRATPNEGRRRVAWARPRPLGARRAPGRKERGRDRHGGERPPGDAPDSVDADPANTASHSSIGGSTAKPARTRRGRRRATARRRAAGDIGRRGALPFGDPGGDARVGRQSDRIGPDGRTERGQTCGRDAGDRHGQEAIRGSVRSRRSASQVNPTASGPRKKLPWRFAQTRTSNGMSQTTRRVLGAAAQDQQLEGEQGHAEQLGAEGQRGGRDGECGEGQERRVAVRPGRPRGRRGTSTRRSRPRARRARGPGLSSRRRRRPGDNRTCAPHCWSNHGWPPTVKVQLSTVGIARSPRISAPARSW